MLRKLQERAVLRRMAGFEIEPHFDALGTNRARLVLTPNRHPLPTPQRAQGGSSRLSPHSCAN